MTNEEDFNGCTCLCSALWRYARLDRFRSDNVGAGNINVLLESEVTKMTLSEMYEILNVPFDVYDIDGKVVKGCSESDDIPAFMSDVEVTSINRNLSDELEVYTNYHDFTKAVQYVIDRANKIYEDMGDSYHCDNIYEAQKAMIAGLTDLKFDIDYIINNLKNLSDWDFALEKVR